MRDLIHDAETYPNLFSICFFNTQTQKFRMFEMSSWRNDWDDFRRFTKNCSNGFVRWVGFNNYYFDYQVIHHCLMKFKLGKFSGEDIAREAHRKANEIINALKEDKFGMMVWDNNHVVPQVDLYRIHHFDNVARATSLKVLEFNMRSETVEDLPFDPMVPLTEEQRLVVLKYNQHDVSETYRFYLKSLEMIRFREELTEKYGKNFINYNDTKIGKEYLIMELENAGIKCFSFDDDGRKPIQTKRPVIRIKDVIFPYIEFKRPEFNAVLDWLKKQTIKETKGVFTEIDDLGELEKYANLKQVKGKVKNLNCIIDGFQFDFGTGGIHGSIDSTIVTEDEDHAIIDYDVTSLYPSIAIVNEVFPQHMTRKFCDIYGQMKHDRVSYKKGTPENAMLKLALNGVYGDSNNRYSPFYDPQYTMTITINGQLMLCMLAEKMMEIEGVSLIQINTDGITIRVPRAKIDAVEAVNKKWMETTKLELERADYSRMFIRDVNNYIGEYTDGKLKRKGAYEWDALYRPEHPNPASIQWHKNHSAIVVQRAAEEHLVNNVTIEDFIEQYTDHYDFMLRTKVPRTSKLMWGEDQIQNVTRYYISTNGEQFVKIMPPLKKNPDKWRNIKIHDGWKTTPMNTMGKVANIDYRWYIEEAYKLVSPLQQGLLKQMME